MTLGTVAVSVGVGVGVGGHGAGLRAPVSTDGSVDLWEGTGLAWALRSLTRFHR